MNNNVIESFQKELEEKFTSPFYGIFIIYWCLCNWKVFYITFFVSEKLIGNKLKYIENIYKWDIIETYLFLFIMPFLFTSISVFFIPRILTNYFYIEKIKNNKKKSIKKIKAEKKIADKEKELEKTRKEIELLRTDTDTALTVNKDLSQKEENNQKPFNYKDEKIKELDSIVKIENNIESEIRDQLLNESYYENIKEIGEILFKEMDSDKIDFNKVNTSLLGFALKENFLDIEKDNNQKDEEFYILTQKGEYLQKNFEKFFPTPLYIKRPF